MSEVTLKNTKAEILDALNAALQREKEAKQIKVDPIAEEKKKKEVEIVESTKKAVEQNVFSQDLINKFNDLQTAIAIEEARLAELFGIEKELQNLTLAVNAGKDILAKMEEEKRERTNTLQNEIQILTDEYNQKNIELKDEYSQKNAELKADFDASVKALKIEREREAEEFTYNLKRSRAIDENEWLDKKVAREAELYNKEQQATRMLEEVQNKTDYIVELEKKVSNFPSLIEEEVAKAVKTTTENLDRDYNHKIEISSKEYANTISQLEYKVEALTQELGKAYKLSDSLQTKLDKAYNEMRELAAKTVETSGGVRFITNPQQKSSE